MSRKLADYMQHALECRRLARVLNMPEHRQSLLDMASTWEKLADERTARMTPERTAVPFVSSWPQNK